MRRFKASRETIQVIDQICAQEPDLPLLRYIVEQIEQYMAVESVLEEQYKAIESAVKDGLERETTQIPDNVVQNGNRRNNNKHIMRN